jgi:hypothetical protein
MRPLLFGNAKLDRFEIEKNKNLIPPQNWGVIQNFLEP